jgi:hypothetical protein
MLCWVLVVELGFNGLCFEWVLVVYVSMDYFGTFQAKMWVDLRWHVHNDLYKLNTISFEMIIYVSNIIVSCF